MGDVALRAGQKRAATLPMQVARGILSIGCALWYGDRVSNPPLAVHPSHDQDVSIWHSECQPENSGPRPLCSPALAARETRDREACFTMEMTPVPLPFTRRA